ncbi:MAG TPA: TIGR04222 domain-containing membrane protein [Thermoanaerobaculia bacterium]|nr:TIGR04222 domain-containing membrane protein [Thermoanaerobaculia bacterium]
MNPLDMMGPDFLRFYLFYCVTVLVGGWAMRSRLLTAAEPSPGALRWSPSVYPREGDAYGIALLRGGPREVVPTVLGSLVSAGLITVVGRSLHRPNDDPPPPLAPIESDALAALAAADSGIGIAAGESVVRRAVEPYLKQIGEDLRRQGLVLSEVQIQKFQRLRLLVLMALPALGMAKIVVAIGRGRTNIGYLVLMMIVFMVAAFFLLRPPARTRAGDRYLSWLRESHKGLASQLSHGYRAGLSEIALVSGIYGLQMLPAMLPLNTALQPVPADMDKRKERGDGGGYVDGGGGGSCGGGGGGGGSCGGGGGCGGCGG